MENGNLTPLEQSHVFSLPPSEIIRLWKDEEYRQSSQLSGVRLPESPVGVVELSDAELKDAIQAIGPRDSISTTWCGEGSYCG